MFLIGWHVKVNSKIVLAAGKSVPSGWTERTSFVRCQFDPRNL